jgi:ABC-2 type transport system ATP-binding protein
MNAQEYLLFYGELYGLDKKTCLQRSDELLGRFGLGEVKSKRLGEFSKGMRQKLALVRALIHNPPVLLLDEPTSAMDPESSRLVRDSIHSLRDRNRAVLLCTHNLAEAEELADKVAIIRHGKIILNDTTANLKQQLLGPPEFEARLANHVDGWSAELPGGVELCSQGENWLRFRVKDPASSNPDLIRHMLDSHLDLVSFQEVPRTLEQAYLAATHQAASQEELLHA